MSRFTTNSRMIDQIVTDTTSEAFDISLRRKLGVELLLEDPLGSATVDFEVSNDGENFVAYNRLTTNITDTNTEFDERVDSYTLDGTTPSTYLTFPVGDHFRLIRTNYTTVDGAIVTSEIDDAGTGYSEDDVLTIAGGAGGTITVLTVDGDGVVLTYELTTAGTDYTIGSHAGTGGDGSDFALNVLTVNSGTFTALLQTID